jgi:hypothetical protein
MEPVMHRTLFPSVLPGLLPRWFGRRLARAFSVGTLLSHA